MLRAGQRRGFHNRHFSDRLLAQEELMSAPTQVHPDYSVVVITVPDLRDIYTSSFAAARQAVVEPTTLQPTES